MHAKILARSTKLSNLMLPNLRCVIVCAESDDGNWNVENLLKIVTIIPCRLRKRLEVIRRFHPCLWTDSSLVVAELPKDACQDPPSQQQSTLQKLSNFKRTDLCCVIVVQKCRRSPRIVTIIPCRKRQAFQIPAVESLAKKSPIPAKASVAATP